MNLEKYREQLPDTAKDIKLNLSTVLTKEGAPGLTDTQLWGTALSCAYQTQNTNLIEAIENEATAHLTPEHRAAAKSASTIMAMNNIYYRFLHLVEDKEISQMPARLRMSVIGKPGIDKTEFELYCLAVSVMNGCGNCINAHISEIKKGGLTNESAQSAARIASVINAAAHA